jgi:thiamine biosynthesis lipoprotein
MAVDPLLTAALRMALNAAEVTDGAVDPTLGAALVSIGYDRDFADVPAVTSEPVRPVTPAGLQLWRRIVIENDVVTLPTGVQLDLGATAKAWAADIAAAHIAAELGCGTLVNLGGDLAVGGLPPDGGWRVRVAEHHADTGGDGPVIALRTGGLATSSTAVRSWERAGVPLHHVLDPRTGLPAVPLWRYVSVAAASCVDANTGATAAVVLGLRALAWLAERDLPARLVAADGTVTTVGGWPAPAEAPVREVA